MIDAPEVRAIRARLNETQEIFGQRFGCSRFHVMSWEKYGIASSPEIERQIAELSTAKTEGADGQRNNLA
jgi:DNA-binding transcriptional regulator YiaG